MASDLPGLCEAFFRVAGGRSEFEAGLADAAAEGAFAGSGSTGTVGFGIWKVPPHALQRAVFPASASDKR